MFVGCTAGLGEIVAFPNSIVVRNAGVLGALLVIGQPCIKPTSASRHVIIVMKWLWIVLAIVALFIGRSV